MNGMEWPDQAEFPLKGTILTFKDIKQAVENKPGGPVSGDYIWDLFRRNGWSKKAPRPKHPKQNEEVQQDFKKNFQNYWPPAGAKSRTKAC